MNKGLLILVFLSTFSCLRGQQLRTVADVLTLLHGQDPLVDKVIDDPGKYRLQFIFSSFSEGGELITIDGSSDAYFFPASTVKLPLAILTLEKLERLNIPIDAVLKLNKDVNCGNTKFIEQSKKYNRSFRQLIEEMIAASDNHHYNALYQFVTPEEINARLQELGFNETRIYKSFRGCSRDEELTTNSLQVVDRRGGVIYRQEIEQLSEIEMLKRYPGYSSEKLIGEKHENKEGVIVSGPFDFNYNLEFPLSEMHEMIIRLSMPSSFKSAKRFALKEQNRAFLMKCLEMFPNETTHGRYKGNDRYPDNIYKYIVHGEDLSKANKVTTNSKIGISYGFTTEVSLINVPKEKKKCFLSISIYTNANKTVNDGKYEYDSVARPFMARVSNMLIEHLSGE